MNLNVLKAARAEKEAQAKSEQMDMRKLHFAGTTEVSNQEGGGQAYELRDENDLTVAYVADPDADTELVRRWNAFPELVAKLQELYNIATHPQATKEAIKMIAREAMETLRNLETK